MNPKLNYALRLAVTPIYLVALSAASVCALVVDGSVEFRAFWKRNI